MLGQDKRQTRTNLLLWIAVSLMSIIGLGANVYKANTGEPIEWASTIAEACVLLAALCFIFAYFKGRKQGDSEEQKEKEENA